MVKCISLLGSTGSIGWQTLDVAKKLGIPVAALTAGSNVEKLARQCEEFHPKLAVLGTEEAAKRLQQLVPGQEVAWGEEGLLRAASVEEADCVVTAVMGMVGLKPTLAAIDAGKRIALANKETLVCAGDLVMARARARGVEIVPVDSEHSAIFQCLMGSKDPSELEKILLTCSGGPFFGKKAEQLEKVTKADALRHPNWSMGAKITIDSASLMNKGLEVIEAMHLYGVPLEKIQVLIHRQSIVHSLVEFTDGAVMAQLGTPDMRLPIQLALTYPQRLPSPAPKLNLLTCPPLEFQEPDLEAFPCLAMAMEAAKKGGNACAVLNGANEVAVAAFLEDKITFGQIPKLVRHALDTVPFLPKPDLEQILDSDRKAREAVTGKI